MRKQSFIMGSIILALGGVLAKGLGAVYKIPLTNILGTTGIGIYYLIFPIFSFVLTLSSSGVATALNILVAKERKKHNRKNELINAFFTRLTQNELHKGKTSSFNHFPSNNKVAHHLVNPHPTFFHENVKTSFPQAQSKCKKQGKLLHYLYMKKYRAFF